MINNYSVSSFWHGGDLSDLEVTCIRSFLYHGYEYNLYLYNESKVDNIPEGVEIKDASEILSEDEIFYYQKGFNSGSVSGFSNIFRYEFLFKKGGIWVDTDLCLVSDDLDFNSTNVFVEEPSREKKVASCLIKSRMKNPILRKCIKTFNEYNKETMEHGETGPELVTKSVYNSNLNSLDFELKGSENYFPFSWKKIERVFYDEIEFNKNWKTIHFWNAWLDDQGIDKNGSYPSWSLYEKLKNKYMK